MELFEPHYSWTTIVPSISWNGMENAMGELLEWKERISKTDGKLKDLFNLVAWDALNASNGVTRTEAITNGTTQAGILVDGIRRRSGLYKVIRSGNSAWTIRVHKWNPIYVFNSKAAWEEFMVHPQLYTGVPDSVWNLDDVDEKCKWIGKWVVILPSRYTILELNKLARVTK